MSRRRRRFIYAVGRFNQGIRREMRTRLKAFSLTVQEFTTLSVLAARPGFSNAQLARRALVTPQSMIEMPLAKLSKAAGSLVVPSTLKTHGCCAPSSRALDGRCCAELIR